jgi:hypothetical protein
MYSFLPLYEYIYITQQLYAIMTSTSRYFALDELFTDSNKSSFDLENNSGVTDATSFEEAKAMKENENEDSDSNTLQDAGDFHRVASIYPIRRVNTSNEVGQKEKFTIIVDLKMK